MQERDIQIAPLNYICITNQQKKGKSLPHFAFKHFHNFNSMGEMVENNPQHRSHSFFGLLYYAPNNDGIGTIHPESPKY